MPLQSIKNLLCISPEEEIVSYDVYVTYRVLRE
jgi:hypothetical protein